MVWAPCTRFSVPPYSGLAVMSTIDGVRDTTERKSANIDSLTGSIQWASSTMNSAGEVRVSVAVLISEVMRRRRASGSIWGSAISGSAMPRRSSSNSRSCGSAFDHRCRARARARAASPCRPEAPVVARSNCATRPKGISLEWDSQNAHVTSTPRAAANAATSLAIRLLPMPGGPTTFTTSPRPSIARLTMASKRPFPSAARRGWPPHVGSTRRAG